MEVFKVAEANMYPLRGAFRPFLALYSAGRLPSFGEYEKSRTVDRVISSDYVILAFEPHSSDPYENNVLYLLVVFTGSIDRFFDTLSRFKGTNTRSIV